MDYFGILYTANSIAETEDWWGWRHLTLHVVMALAALGTKPRRRFEWLDLLADPAALVAWLESQNWDDRVAFTSNAVQNRIACMQYVRDFMHDVSFAPAINIALDYLSQKCNPTTGLWGSSRPDTPQMLSEQVQAAYHFWLLYSYDFIEIPYPHLAIPFVLKTQSALGGYGPYPTPSSACEDIDLIDPIVRFGGVASAQCATSARRALPWVIHNFNDDGGAVFRRDAEFVYGHQLLSSRQNESNLFATWFRLLSLALIDRGSAMQAVKWSFLDAPGLQFDPNRSKNSKECDVTLISRADEVMK